MKMYISYSPVPETILQGTEHIIVHKSLLFHNLQDSRPVFTQFTDVLQDSEDRGYTECYITYLNTMLSTTTDGEHMLSIRCTFTKLKEDAEDSQPQIDWDAVRAYISSMRMGSTGERPETDIVKYGGMFIPLSMKIDPEDRMFPTEDDYTIND